MPNAPMICDASNGNLGGSFAWNRVDRRYEAGRKRGDTYRSRSARRGAQLERRAMKRAERAEWQDDVDRITATALADAEALAALAAERDGSEYLDDTRPTCATCGWVLDAAWMCGCDEPLDFDDEADIMLDAGLPADASYDDLARLLDQADDEAHALAWELAGWGETSFDADDIQWGFGIDRTLQRRTTTGTGRRRPKVGIARAVRS